MKKVIQNGVVFEINEKYFTASVVESPAASNSIFIPRAIFYESKDYIVVKISEGAFKGNQNISSLSFEEDSEVKIIEKNVFRGSSIMQISIPAKLEIFEEEWCSGTNKLVKVNVSSQNNHFQIINDELLIMSIDNNEKVLIFVSRNVKNFVLPSYITRIAPCSLENTISLFSLSIPADSKLRSIGQKAFQFSRLNKISIPSTLQHLEEGWCSNMDCLSDIEISPNHEYFEYINNEYLIRKSQNDEETVLLFVNRSIVDSIVPSCITRIGSFSFAYCEKLKSISFNENSKIKSIGQNAFMRSKLQNISIPASLEYLDNGWCNQVSSLKNVMLSPNNKHFVYVDKSFLIEKGNVLIFARRDITQAKIPSFITRITNYAFQGCYDLNDVLFTEDSSLIEIDDDSFTECLSLTNISPIPKKVKRIGKSAFQYCEMLESVDFGLSDESELEIIDNSAFDSCTNLETISMIPKHVKKIGDCAFGGCQKLSSIKFQEGTEIEYIGNDAFSYTSIENIPIPASVKGLGENFSMFHENDLQFEISLENEYNEYYENKYLISKLKDDFILIYANLNIEKALIPSKVTRIGLASFQRCKKLHSLSFKSGSNLRSIGSNAFSYSSLKSLELPDNLEIIEDNWCFLLTDLIDIKVSPKNKVFRLFDNQILIRKNAHNSYLKGDDIIFALRDIKSVKIPSFISRIGMYAFAFCFNLKTVEFDESSALKELCSSSFTDCRNLKSIVSIPDSLKTVGDFCFSRSANLKSLEFLSDVLNIQYGSFYQCSSISILSFPNGKHISLGFNAFLNVEQEIVLFIPSNGEVIYIKNF